MPGVHARPTGGGHDAPPNFVFILADDLREDEMEVGFNRSLPGRRSALQTELIDQGATLPNFFVTTPLCCPSRVSFLTGQYAHNHGVYSNSALVSEPPGFGGLPRFYNDDRDLTSLGAWLQQAGYCTALVGKYLNGYPNRQGLDQQGVTEDYVPRGWDEWFSAFLYDSDFSYHHFRSNENGTIVGHDDHHLCTVEEHHAVDFIRRRSGHAPFFLFISTSAPHAPTQPRREHTGAHRRAGVVPRVPESCDEADLSDKPAHISDQPELRDHPGCWSDFWSKRLDMTLATDELIDAVVAELDQQGVLDNTYIIFTSDNGVLRGEHHIGGKSVPYEESVRVPLVVRGPGVPSGQTLDHLVANIDIAPTLLDLAGSPLPGTSPPVDGESLVPVLLDALPTGRWRDAVLLELASPIPANVQPHDVPRYSAVRTRRHVYVEYETGEVELYDLGADPHQLDSMHDSAPPDLLARLHDQLEALRDCEGTGCATAARRD